MRKMFALTTTDNKYNPLIDFDMWYISDRYGICEVLSQWTSVFNVLYWEKYCYDFDRIALRAMLEMLCHEKHIFRLPKGVHLRIVYE